MSLHIFNIVDLTSISCSFNGWGVTLFDSLDTMILMNLTDELRRARPVVERASFAMSRVSISNAL